MPNSLPEWFPVAVDVVVWLLSVMIIAVTLVLLIRIYQEYVRRR